MSLADVDWWDILDRGSGSHLPGLAVQRLNDKDFYVL